MWHFRDPGNVNASWPGFPEITKWTWRTVSEEITTKELPMCGGDLHWVTAEPSAIPEWALRQVSRHSLVKQAASRRIWRLKMFTAEPSKRRWGSCASHPLYSPTSTWLSLEKSLDQKVKWRESWMSVFEIRVCHWFKEHCFSVFMVLAWLYRNCSICDIKCRFLKGCFKQHAAKSSLVPASRTNNNRLSQLLCRSLLNLQVLEANRMSCWPRAGQSVHHFTQETLCSERARFYLITCTMETCGSPFRPKWDVTGLNTGGGDEKKRTLELWMRGRTNLFQRNKHVYIYICNSLEFDLYYSSMEAVLPATLIAEYSSMGHQQA